MTTTTLVANLCPACSEQLPPAYRHDHVAIDRALAGDPTVLARLDHGDRVEAYLVGRRRGMTANQLAGRLGLNNGTKVHLEETYRYSAGLPLTQCPTCGGLFWGPCQKRACISADIAEDHRNNRLGDL